MFASTRFKTLSTASCFAFTDTCPKCCVSSMLYTKDKAVCFCISPNKVRIDTFFKFKSTRSCCALVLATRVNENTKINSAVNFITNHFFCPLCRPKKDIIDFFFHNFEHYKFLLSDKKCANMTYQGYQNIRKVSNTFRCFFI